MGLAWPLNSTPFSSRPILFAFCVLLRFSQADPGATPVLINELDARCFQRAANGQVVGRIHRRFVLTIFSPTNGGQTDCGFSGEIFGAPVQESAGGTDLGRNQLFVPHLDLFRSI